MSAQWVIAGAQLAGSALNLFGEAAGAGLERELGGINDTLTRRQNQIASEADANARIRATQSLISSQRAGLGASGVAGGRTSRLLEARARINASREQRQANQSRIFADTSSRLNRIAGRAGARRRVFTAANDLLTAGIGAFGPNPAGNPGSAGEPSG